MAIDNVFSIVCDTVECATGNLGAIEEIDPNCPPEQTLSEINFLEWMHPTLGVAPTDWSLLLDWTTVIDNTDATDVKVKRMPVIGDKPVEERVDIQQTGGRVTKGQGTYTLNITMPYVTPLLRDYLRKLQCNKMLPVIWYEDRGGNMYGQNDGIQTSTFEVSFPQDRGDDAYNRAELIIKWKAQTDPDRIESPLQ